MYDATVGKVLKSKEALLVQFAVDKRLGIAATRQLLQTLPPQTRLRNAVRSEPVPLTDVRMSTYHEYEQWLLLLARHFQFESRCDLVDAVSDRHVRTKLENIRAPTRSVNTYGFGLQGSLGDRNPWADATVGCVRKVLDLVASIKKEAIKCARNQWPDINVSISDEELERYVELRFRHVNGVVGDIVEPVVRIVCLAMSTNPKNTRLGYGTWPDGQLPDLTFGHRGPSMELEQLGTWQGIMGAVISYISRWEGRGVPVLIVLDCALGWPREMAVAIESHEAGGTLWEERGRPWQEEPWGEDEERPLYRDSQTPEEEAWRKERNLFFRRKTETHVRNCLPSGDRPYGPFGLDVGADKSARTTHQALRLIDELRHKLDQELPVLTTRCGPITQSAVIEVTTVEAKGWRDEHTEGGSSQRNGREAEEVLSPSPNADSGGRKATKSEREAARRMDLMRDAASDFLNGLLEAPSDVGIDDEVAQKEGWIWHQRIRIPTEPIATP